MKHEKKIRKNECFIKKLDVDFPIPTTSLASKIFEGIVSSECILNYSQFL